MPARKAASSASSIRTEARLGERGRAISARSLERSAHSASSPEQRPPPLPVRSPAMALRLALETSAARALGGLSRVARRGGGTTIPGKALWKLDPGAVDQLAARLPHGVAVMSATNGKTTTTAMAAEILGGEHRLAWNRAGANLLSGIASALVASRNAELGLSEVDEGALPEAVARLRPRVVTLGNLFRDQLDRYGELEIVAERWRAAIAALPDDATLVVNADDAVVADLADGREKAVRFGLDDPTQARPSLQHA